LILPAVLPGRTHITNQYTLRVRRREQWPWTESPRDALGRWLRERGIGSEIYYPVPLHAQECFRAYGPHRALPVAEALASEVISLPVFPELTSEERGTVVDAISDFVFSAARLTPDDGISSSPAERA
jgi:dTDP-4-amino-4,6-dideoxygalactose transaminase